MDEKIIKIVAAKLRRIGEAPINAEKLTEIREEVYKATRSNKFASFANVKKWVKAARGHMKAAEKKAKPAHKAKPAKAKHAKAPARHEKREAEFVPPVVSRKVEDSVNFIKEETAPALPAQEVVLPKPTIVFDKVYLQSIKFEIAGIRQTMERVSRQLDKLEKELSSHGED
ncbi:MAG: hypothetical protein WC717_01810 [Candidatus Micrarchaeia archaeon]|jgi:hypothetical protein